MVRNYRRKSDRQSWDPLQMAKAIEEVAKTGTPLLTASKLYNIPRNTLRRRVQLYRAEYENMELPCMKGLGRFDPVFSPLQEEEFAAFLKKQEELLHGLTSKECRVLAFQIAEQNGIVHNFREGMAGRDWLNGFFKRQSHLSMRKPEGVSSNRAMAFNKVVLELFYTLLLRKLQNHEFTPDRIFNVHETGVTVIPKTLSKIVATKGKKQVGKKTSGERGQTVTATLCVSAAGDVLPPLFIFPRKRMNQKLMEGALPGAWGIATESGWSTMDAFFEWFKWFVDFTKPTEDKPVLLLLDGHYSHVKNLEMIHYARANHTTILCFPPHCTHRLQPLDVSVMKPVSVYYADEISDRERKNPGRNTQLADIPLLFGRALAKAATPSVIMNGFRKTGIHPFNSEGFSDADFAPSEVTNRPAPPELGGTTFQEIPEEEAPNGPAIASRQTCDDFLNDEPSPFPYLSSDSDSDAEVRRIDDTGTSSDPPLNKSDQLARKRIRLNVDTTSDDDNDDSEHSQVQPHTKSKYRKVFQRKTTGFEVKPEHIMPIPVANDDPTRKRRPRGKTAALTDDDYLMELTEAKEKIKEKETRKNQRKRLKATTTSGSKKLQGKSRRRRAVHDLKIESGDEDEGNDDDDDGDAICPVCGGLYSESNELWIQCDGCEKWTHTTCVGVSEEDCNKDYVCDSCSKRRRSTRSTRSGTQRTREILDREQQEVSEDDDEAEDVGSIEIEEDAEDVPCIYCTKMYSASTNSWIQCDKCDHWAHMQCAGVSVEDSADDYICKICKRTKK